jgi:hypothetical protein
MTTKQECIEKSIRKERKMWTMKTSGTHEKEEEQCREETEVSAQEMRTVNILT